MLCAAIALIAIYARPWRRSIVFFAALMVAILVHISTIAGASTLMGAPWTSFQLFAGKALLRWRLRDRWISLGWLPVGGSVRIRGMTEEGDVRPGTYSALPPLRKVAIALAGPLALLIFALLLLGPSGVAQSIAHGPRGLRDVLAEGLGWQHGAPALTGFVALLDHGSVFQIAGVVAVQMAWINLLPLPAMNGGVAVGVLLRQAGIRWPAAAGDLAALATVACGIGSVLAFCVALAHAW